VLATSGHGGVEDRSRLVRADRPPSATGEQVIAWRLLVAVGLAYLVAQVVLFSSSRPPGWDESIYLSQVTPGRDLAFDAWRARGITLLVAPVTVLGGSVQQVRLFLMVASAIAVTASFRVWIPLIGFAAPVAAVMFSFTWLALLGGSEVMPNLWAAILGLATAGLVARRLEDGEARHAVLAATALAAMALTRPTEAAVLASAIGLYVVVFSRTEWRLLGSLAVGLALGWLPWFVEMSIRFGGPVRALDEAAVEVFVNASVSHNLFIHLAATGGKLTADRAPLGGVIWWGLLAALTIVAIAKAGRGERMAATICSLGALALAFEYIVFVSTLSAPRFLLPVYALGSVPTAIGAMLLLRARMRLDARSFVTRTAGAAVLVLLVPWAIWQGTAGIQYERVRMASTVPFRDVGLTIRRLAGGRPCSFLSPHGYPMIQFASGCLGADLPRRRGPTAAELAKFRTDSEEVFVILKDPARRGSPLRGLTPVPARGPSLTWLIYQVSLA
jgi:hypothetical protein